MRKEETTPTLQFSDLSQTTQSVLARMNAAGVIAQIAIALT